MNIEEVTAKYLSGMQERRTGQIESVGFVTDDEADSPDERTGILARLRKLRSGE